MHKYCTDFSTYDRKFKLHYTFLYDIIKELAVPVIAVI